MRLSDFGACGGEDLCPASVYVIGVTNNLRMTRGQYLYFLSVPSGYYKVGVSRDPEGRRRSLQTGSPEPITLAGFSALRPDGVDARELERLIHEALGLYPSRGEWFKADPSVIGRAYKEAWCKLRFPLLHQRWKRLCLHIAAKRARAALTQR